MTMDADMDKIREGLYLGGITPTSDVQLLLEHNISHVLTLNSEPIQLKKENGFSLKYINCMDIPQTDLLSYFKECFDFLDEALNVAGHRVLVHCFAGASRSATIVIAYLMYKERLSLDDATMSVKSHRPGIRPNEGFHEQLVLFERMGSMIDEQNDLYRSYKLRLLAEKVQAGDTEAVSLLKHTPLSSSDMSVNYYKCAKCRRILFRKTSVLSHPIGKGEEAFGWQSRQPNYSLSQSVLLDDDGTEKCDRSLFIEPVQWMADVITAVEGKLACPKCNAKLGSFVWYGEKCPCGSWVAPSFHIQTNKVDLVQPRPAAPVKPHPQAQISNSGLPLTDSVKLALDLNS